MWVKIQKSLGLNSKRKALHSHSIHQVENYVTCVAKAIPFFWVALHSQLGQSFIFTIIICLWKVSVKWLLFKFFVFQKAFWILRDIRDEHYMSNILDIYYGVLSLKIIEFFLEFQEMASLVHWCIYLFIFQPI